jgi:hypothetical protein
MVICICYNDTLDAIAHATGGSRDDPEPSKILNLLVRSYFCDEESHRRRSLDTSMRRWLKDSGVNDNALATICNVMTAETGQFLPGQLIFTADDTCIRQINKDTYLLKLW